MDRKPVILLTLPDENMYSSSSNESNSEDYSSEENDRHSTRRKPDSESEEDPRPQVLLDLWNILSELKAPSTFASSGEVVSIPPGKLSKLFRKQIRISCCDFN